MNPTKQRRVAVMHVDTKADEDGYAVHLTVRRLLSGQVPFSHPLATDVPPDVRAALRAWLDTADHPESS